MSGTKRCSLSFDITCPSVAFARPWTQSEADAFRIEAQDYRWMYEQLLERHVALHRELEVMRDQRDEAREERDASEARLAVAPARSAEATSATVRVRDAA